MKRMIFLIFLLFTVRLYSTTIYVDYVAIGSDNGTSWADAYTSFQSALDAAQIGDQIWVASGTYTPSYDYGLGIGSRGNHFRMIEDIEIYGGFAGTETALNQRTNFGAGETNETILSGDINGDDVVSGSGETLSITNNTENCYHVFYHPDGLGLTSSSVLDGFTISGGNADDTENYQHNYGGGIYNYNNSPTIRNCTISGNYAADGAGVYNEFNSSPSIINCTISDNRAYYSGGGLCNYLYSSPTFSNCSITTNRADYGGGLCNYEFSSPTITNCTISGNTASEDGGGFTNYYNSSPVITNCTISGNSASLGGGVHNIEYSSPTITNCTISENISTDGGGVYNIGYSSPTITNSIISDNMASDDGGGLYNIDYSSPTIISSTISNNSASNGGGVFNLRYSIPTITNCTMSSNSATNGGSLYNELESSPIITECIISNNNASNGAGVFNKLHSIPEITNCTISENHATNGGGLYNIDYSSPIISNCTISSNNASENGGGLSNYDNSNPTITDCSFINNTASENGGGLYNYSYSNPILSNCTISGNNANYGGGLCNELNSSPIIRNCTISVNSTSSEGAGAGLCNFNNSSPIITDCIISGNNTSFRGTGGGLFNVNYSSPIITNCTISNNSVIAEGGGLCNYHYASPTITNCIIIGNNASSGAGLCNAGNSSPTIINCTISGNNATEGGGLYNYVNSSPTISNSIIWDNIATTGKQVYNNTGTTTLNYSCYSNDVDDLYVNEAIIDTANNNNITENPKFVNPAVGDYRIYGNSPCVDTGDNDSCDATYDIRGIGFSRKLDKTNGADGTIDMGAYEYKYSTDPAVKIIYVKHNASGANNGYSWADAYTSFQSALNVAQSTDQIWVASGTYKPSSSYDLTNSSRYYHFRMKPGVAIYGGFAGTETEISQRTNFGAGEANETILSGDIGSIGDNSDNCYHVFYHPDGLGLTNTAVLDGFTITGGNAEDTENYTHNNGGGIYNYSNSPTITNCTISDNTAFEGGGGLFNYFYSSPTISNCTISDNTAFEGGGGLCNHFYSSPTISNCTISDNTASKGGGLCNYRDSSPTISNCTISDNTASEGGGLCNYRDSSPTISNCTISDNTASEGGGLCNYRDSSPTISNCTINGNSADYGGGLFNYFYSSPTISNCTISDNTASEGGGLRNFDNSSPTISNCTISDNTANRGGGLSNYEFSSPTISNCTISGNSANYGGGLSNYYFSSPSIINCTISNNRATNGGGICNYDFSNPTITNCTIIRNNASDLGGGLCNIPDSSPIINNSIIWENTATTGKQIYHSYGTITFNYSCYSNGEGDLTILNGFNTNSTNHSNNPQFVDADNNDYRIKRSSPCINTGNNTYNSVTNDIRGYARIQGGNIDMGAYEWTEGIDIDITPTIQASNLQFSNLTRTGMTVRWTRGNGEACLLLGRQQYKIPATPLTDGATYSSNSSSYTDIANTAIGDAKVLYNGTDANPSVNISGLTKYILYYFRVFEYNVNPGKEAYLQTTSTNNPRSRWTLRRDGLADEDLSIDSEYPYPNPVSNSINTKLDVFEAGNITAYLFDNSGKQIAELYNKYHEFGTYDLQFDLSQIAQGTYQLVINKGSEAVVYPISVIR